MSFKILLDATIMGWEVFHQLGEVRAVPASEITPDAVRNMDALIIRTTTPVTPELLAGSRVSFVGTISIGFDHIARAYLDQAGIVFASAPGSNADSVVEYVLSAISQLGRWGKLDLNHLTLGIVGVGNIGHRLYNRARQLGWQVRLCDPPLAEAGRSLADPWLPLAACTGCDVLSLHVPYTVSGRYATHHLLSEAELAGLKPRFLINAARGGVVNEAALLGALAKNRISGAVLDTWEKEPFLNPQVLDQVTIATPHIAGYALDAKIRGVNQVAAQLADHVGMTVLPVPYPASDPVPLHLGAQGWPELLDQAVTGFYSIETDNQALKALKAFPETLTAAFAALRRHYRVRREWFTRPVQVPSDCDPIAVSRLQAAGFQVHAQP